MRMHQLRFRVMYWIGFKPWDGHQLPVRLTQLVEGPESLPPGRALDVGCGTGDTSIYLARGGWDVTGVDFVDRALNAARTKTQQAGVNVRYVQGDATRLRSYGIAPVTLVADNGCYHGLADQDRDAYAAELAALVAPGGRVVIVGFGEGKRRGPAGINPAEIERRFGRDWELVASGKDAAASTRADDPLFFYDLRRRQMK